MKNNESLQTLNAIINALQDHSEEMGIYFDAEYFEKGPLMCIFWKKNDEEEVHKIPINWREK